MCQISPTLLAFTPHEAGGLGLPSAMSRPGWADPVRQIEERALEIAGLSRQEAFEIDDFNMMVRPHRLSIILPFSGHVDNEDFQANGNLFDLS